MKSTRRLSCLTVVAVLGVAACPQGTEAPQAVTNAAAMP